MLDFSENDEKAKLVAMHYAEQFNNVIVLEILNESRGVKNKEEAKILSKFFWEVLDATAYDREKGNIILGEANLQYWVERLMNIIGGYLKKSGYETEWDKACDEA